MTKRLLIEATHPEETRVVVVDGKRLEEFDYETASKRQLKGNIYLAKVTRVEPSLQAAFVDYGGNRHGFLAFSEIHPDYYQIPVADREALLAEQAAMDADNDEFEDARPSRRRDRDRDRNSGAPAEMMPATDDAQDDGVHEHQDEPATEGPDIEASADDGEDEGGDEAADDSAEDIAEAITAEPDMASEDDELQGQALLISSPRLEGPVIEDSHDEHHEVAEIIEGAGEAQDEPAAEAAAEFAAPGAGGDGDGDGDAAEVSSDSGSVREAPRPPVVVETVGGDEAEEMRPRRTRHVRRYKIQEVIKRRQILLVQVTKEERGNKGAALTTYLSLAGRYCVLMPNTARGGGISRKITSVTDRKRLKSILGEMEIPDGMAVIVRTAGQERNKTELKRDYEYLLRLWDEIRELTLQSRAPALIYEEANLIKRAIRDMYARDVEEILVEGDEELSRTPRTSCACSCPPMPRGSSCTRIRRSICSRSSRSKARSTPSTIRSCSCAPAATSSSTRRRRWSRSTSTPAARRGSATSRRRRCAPISKRRRKSARQLRLRDLAGLIVIDFIDMEESRNNAAVERKLKEALRNDRARIQVGRISPFGLLELSRQRLRPSLFEASMVTCRHCRGTGHVRSTESTALYMLRAIEDEGLKQRSTGVTVTVPTAVALYILNNKRAALAEIEVRHHMRVTIAADESLVPPEHRMERSKTPIPVPEAKVTVSLPEMPLEDEEVEDEAAEESSEPAVAEEGAPEPMAARAPADEQGARRGRRRRRRGRGRDGQRDGPRDGQRGHGDDSQRQQPRDENRHAAAPEEGAGDSGENEEADDFEPQGDGDQAPSEGGAPRDAGPPGENGERRRRRRGRRGGRRRRRGGERFGDSAEGTNGQEPRHESVTGQEPAAGDRDPERHGEADSSELGSTTTDRTRRAGGAADAILAAARTSPDRGTAAQGNRHAGTARARHRHR